MKLLQKRLLSERRLQKASTLRSKAGRRSMYCMKVRKIIQNIERNLKAGRPYPLDRIAVYIENYKNYPEVRPYAPQVMAKIGQTKVSAQRTRIEMCARLKNVIQNFQGR